MIVKFWLSCFHYLFPNTAYLWPMLIIIPWKFTWFQVTLYTESLVLSMETIFYHLVPSTCFCSYDKHKPGPGSTLMDISRHLNLTRAVWTWSSALKLVGSAVFLFTTEEHLMFAPTILMVRKSKSKLDTNFTCCQILAFPSGLQTKHFKTESV